MELTWLAILASVFMGMGAASIFAFSYTKGYLQELEDAKYQVFWSDADDFLTSVPATGAADDSTALR